VWVERFGFLSFPAPATKSPGWHDLRELADCQAISRQTNVQSRPQQSIGHDGDNCAAMDNDIAELADSRRSGEKSTLRRSTTCSVAEMSGSFSRSFQRKCEWRRIDRQGHETIRSIRRHPPAKDCVMSTGNVAKRGVRTKTIWFGSEPYSLPIEPLTVRISVAVQLTGIGRSKIYELIKARKLDTVKVGASTLITVASLRRLVEKHKR
jgi:hypothetical protein